MNARESTRPINLVTESDEQQPPSINEPGAQATLRSLTIFPSAISAVIFAWIFYVTVVPLTQMLSHEVPLPAKPVIALEPFRIANAYGLFAVMTPHRYEIEFQGSIDGENWIAYPFRY